MRNYIDLIENIYLPDWYANGKEIDIQNPKWDALEFLEDDEFELDWRLCMIPTALIADRNFSPKATSTETAKNRIKSIIDWVSSHNNFVDAFLEKPPIFIMENGLLKLLDGYHRVNVAALSGIGSIPALVGNQTI